MKVFHLVLIQFIIIIYGKNKNQNYEWMKKYNKMRSQERVNLMKRSFTESIFSSANIDQKLQTLNYNLMLTMPSSHQKSINLMRSSHIPDEGLYLNERINIDHKQKSSIHSIEIEKRGVNILENKLNIESEIKVNNTAKNVNNICGKNVSQLVNEIMICTANNIEDIRLPALRNVRFNKIVLQLYNGWLEGIWNLYKNLEKSETISCDNGLQTISTKWKIYNPSLFTYWRKYENMTYDGSYDNNGMTCSSTELKEGFATLKNSFVEVLIIFSNPKNNSNVWISNAQVLKVGEFISLVQYFHSPKLKNNLLKNWIQKIGLKHDFNSHVLRALLMGVNQCLPTSFI